MDKTIMAILPQDQLDSIQTELNEIKALLLEKKSEGLSKGNKYICTREAALLLNVTTRTLATWRQKGIIKVSKIGRRVYFKMSDITELIERNQLN